MRPRTAPKRARTPNCTHVTMERIYTRDDHCFVCGRLPSIGFLYECRQDCDSVSPLSNAPAQGNSYEAVTKSDLRRDLEETGLSESVIRAAEHGEYSGAQLEKLKTQKLELKQVISDSIQGIQLNRAVAQLAAAAEEPSNNDGASNSTAAYEMCNPPCCFRACHTCRPYYKDRIYISFNSVFSDCFTPLSRSDAAVLPTKCAQIMRHIGLLPSPHPSITDTTPSTLLTSLYLNSDIAAASSTSSVVTFKTTQTDMDELDQTRRHRRRFYKIGQRSSGDIARDLSRLPLFCRQGLKTAIQGIFRSSRDSSSDGSNITLPMPCTGRVRDANLSDGMGEFDMGALRRVRRQKERNDLRHGTCDGGFEGVTAPAGLKRTYSVHVGGDEEDDSSSSSDFTVYSCASEGSEVEVSGGVALTEEAVETHTPDILTAPVPGQQRGAINDEMGLETIMTQV